MSEPMTAADIAAWAAGGECDQGEVERMILRHMEHHMARAAAAERERLIALVDDMMGSHNLTKRFRERAEANQ